MRNSYSELLISQTPETIKYVCITIKMQQLLHNTQQLKCTKHIDNA